MTEELTREEWEEAFRKEMIAQWNTRAESAEVERLRAQVVRLTMENKDCCQSAYEMGINAGKDQNAALRARIAELEAGLTWQPMETAPMNGENVIVFCSDNEVYMTMFAGRYTWAGLERSSRPLCWMPAPMRPSTLPKAPQVKE